MLNERETHDLGAKLKELRAERGLTLRQLEEGTGLSNAYLSQLETGEVANPSINVASNLARFFDVSVPELIGEASPAPRPRPEAGAIAYDERLDVSTLSTTEECDTAFRDLTELKIELHTRLSRGREVAYRKKRFMPWKEYSELNARDIRTRSTLQQIQQRRASLARGSAARPRPEDYVSRNASLLAFRDAAAETLAHDVYVKVQRLAALKLRSGVYATPAEEVS